MAHTIIDICQIASFDDAIWHPTPAILSPKDYHCYIPTTHSAVQDKVALPECPHIPLPLSVYTMSNLTHGNSPPIPADPLNPPTTFGLAEIYRQNAWNRLAFSLREVENGDVILDLRGCIKSVQLQTKFNALEDGRTPYFIDMHALVAAVDDFLLEAEKPNSLTSDAAKNIGIKLRRVKVLDLSNCLIFDEDILFLWQLMDMLCECKIVILRHTQLRNITLAQVRELLKRADFIDVCFTEIGGWVRNDIRIGLAADERTKWVVLRGDKRTDLQYISPEVYTGDGKHLDSVETILRVYREYVGKA